MAKSLLILMLMTTQLLAGSCGSVHLCISGDCSFCCLDAGPDSCTCCQKHTEDPSEAGCDEYADEALSGKCCGHCEVGSTEPESQFAVATDSCGCTHIPLVVSSGQPTTVVRSTVSESVEWYSLLIAWLPTLVFDGNAITRVPPMRWHESPAAPDLALTVISAVVIRC